MAWEQALTGGLARVDGLELLGLLLAVFALASHLLATLASRRAHRRRLDAARRLPNVTILKPLRGVDDRLEENLESFFALDYPDLEVVFGAAEASDPGLEVARKVAARHPAVRTRLLAGEASAGLNPKVRLLAHMTRHATSELLVVSDSNVRVRPEWLRETVPTFDDPQVAVASNLLAGVGERSVGATLENLQLNGFIAPAICLGLALGRPPCLVGKSMAVRRADLESLGGWEALADVLAEDYLLGRLLEARGRRAAVAFHVVDTVNERWSLGRFLERHDRWLKMRWRIMPWACGLEIATNATLMAFVWVLLAGGALRAVAGALAVVAGRVLLEAVSTRSLLRGRPVSVASLLLVPLRDLVLAALWAHSRLSSTIRWRGGQHLRIGEGTRLTVAEAPGLVEVDAAERFTAPAPRPVVAGRS